MTSDMGGPLSQSNLKGTVNNLMKSYQMLQETPLKKFEDYFETA